MDGEQEKDEDGQDAYVYPEKTRQGIAGHILTTTKKLGHPGPHNRDGTGNIRPHLCRREREVVPGQKITREAENERAGKEKHTAHPSDLSRLTVGLCDPDADEMDKNKSDHECRRPAVNRPDDPSQWNLGHDPGHAGIGRIQGGLVVQDEHKSRDNLDGKKEKDRTSCIKPDGVFMLRDWLLLQELCDRRETETIIEPG